MAHKVNNLELADVSLASIYTDEHDNDLRQKRHQYSSYNKSAILVSKPHGFHENENDSRGSSTNLSERGHDDDSGCGGCCSWISYYVPILHPFGPFRCSWDLFVMIMLIYTCVEVPVTLAFNVSLRLPHFSAIIALTIDILLCIDILITFRTAYFDRWDRLRLIIDECEIAKRYILGWFFIDLITSLPFEFVLPDNNTLKLVKIFRIFRFVRIIKILRLFKMIKYFDGFMSQFVIRELLIGLKFLKIFALMVLFAHISACGWFFVGRITIKTDSYWSPNGSWVGLHFSTTDLTYIDNSIPTFTKYSYSWYWSVVTLFTTGYGDIHATPGNKLEQWTVSICILVGTCFFAYFIGTLTSLITEGDRIKSVEVQKLEEAQAFCDHKKLPRELSRAVLTHIRYHCGYNYVFDENELIQSLPPYLQNDIHSYLAQTILMQLDFFKSFHKNLQILGQISLKMRSISCNENYSLFQKGDRAKEIYIQRTGESIINYYDGETKILKRGDVIGERSMISPKRKYTVQCITFSEFYVLSVQDIVAILQTEYPTTWTKRWRKMVKSLKISIKNNKKYIRTVNFNKYNITKNKSVSPIPDIKPTNDSDHNLPTTQLPTQETNSKSKHGFNAWINQPSTINTARLSKNGIKSVQLNAIGAVDTSPVTSTNTNTKLPVTTTSPFVNNQYAKSDGKILETNPNPIPLTKSKTNKFISRAKSMNLPALKTSSSHPPPTTPTPKIHKKKTRFGIFVKRNSLDRDAAIHQNARKRANTHITQTKTHTQRTFYDLEYISSSDSSDDSGDIVPHDYDDNGSNSNESDDEISKTYTVHNYHQTNNSNDESNIVSAVDNMDQLYKQFTTAKNNNVPTAIIANKNIRAINSGGKSKGMSGMGGMGGRKGGKFGGKKRRGPRSMKKKINNNKNIHRKQPSNINKKDIIKDMKKKANIKIKEDFIKDIQNTHKKNNINNINSGGGVSPLTIGSYSSVTTYINPVDNMIINDIKINKNSNSDTQTEIIYNNDDEKKQNNRVKFKDEIIENHNENDNDNDDNGFVVMEDYKNENDNNNNNNNINININNIDDKTGHDSSDSTKL